MVIVLYLEVDLSEKFTINLGFIPTRNPNPNDNDGNLLYKALYKKLFQSICANTFLITSRKDKL